ncbi:MAG: DsbA family protein [Thermoleophilia bacterium]|nr:DsbA family protein [Thermoleophilia bacterium]
MTNSLVNIVHFTDPGCPFAFSAERQMRQLEWHYGDQVAVEMRMIVLADSAEEYEAKGFTAELMQKALTNLQQQYDMPISLELRERMSATRDACLAFVAARIHAPEKSVRLLREMRVLTMGGKLLDDPETVTLAAGNSGIDASDLAGWVEEPATVAALKADWNAARHPHESAVTLSYKLAKWSEGWRYTAPSLVISTSPDDAIVVPGFQPIEAIDVAIAHVAPWVSRRANAETVDEVLAWADFPLATAEIAAVRGKSIDATRAELLELGAQYDEVGADGYWMLARVGAGV